MGKMQSKFCKSFPGKLNLSENAFSASYQNELAILRSLRHPNTIALFGYDDDKLILVLEVASNGCLTDLIRYCISGLGCIH